MTDDDRTRTQLPDPGSSVARTRELAARSQFSFSCNDEVGGLLSVLAAAVVVGGRVLELGTGAGVGLAWICRGLADRNDVEVITIERDSGRLDDVRALGWPSWVRFISADAEAILPGLGTFDLVFADAEGGKWTGLPATLNALRPNGILVLDDMDEGRYTDPAHRAVVRSIRAALDGDARLVTWAAAHADIVIAAARSGR